MGIFLSTGKTFQANLIRAMEKPCWVSLTFYLTYNLKLMAMIAVAIRRMRRIVHILMLTVVYKSQPPIFKLTTGADSLINTKPIDVFSMLRKIFKMYS